MLTVHKTPTVVIDDFENVGGSPCNWSLALTREGKDYVFAMHWGGKDVPTHIAVVPIAEFKAALDRLEDPRVLLPTEKDHG